MTGWLGAESVSSCCCCELCQPVRCVIDQHEVEIVPATYRSTSSSLAPTTHRSHWSSSSSITLPSPRTLVSEASIPRTHIRQRRLRESSAYCAATAEPQGEATRLDSSDGKRQGANRKRSHNGHAAALAPGIPHHLQGQAKATSHVRVKTGDLEYLRSHRLSGTGTKLRPRKSSRLDNVEKDHEVKLAAGIGTAVLSHRSTSRATCSGQPFQLFEKDPQHDASLPETSCPVLAGKVELRVLGAAFPSLLARPHAKWASEHPDVLSVASESRDSVQCCDAESIGGDFSPRGGVILKHDSIVHDSRNVRKPRTAVPPASPVHQPIPLYTRPLSEQESYRQLLVPSCVRQAREPAFTCTSPSAHSAGSAQTALPGDKNASGCRTPVRDNWRTPAGIAGKEFIQSSCRCSSAPRPAPLENDEGAVQYTVAAETTSAGVSANPLDTLNHMHPCGQVDGTQISYSFSHLYKDPATAACARVEDERGKGTCDAEWESNMASQMLERSTDADEESTSEVPCRRLPRESASYGWGGRKYGKGTRNMSAPSSCKEKGSDAEHATKRGGVPGASRPSTAALELFASTFPATTKDIKKQRNITGRTPLSDEDYPSRAQLYPEGGVFFYDSSIGCADGFISEARAFRSTGGRFAAENPGHVLAESLSAVLSDAQMEGILRGAEGKSCKANYFRQPQFQTKPSMRLQRAFAADMPAVATCVEDKRKQSQRNNLSSSAQCADRQPIERASMERQKWKKDARLGRCEKHVSGVVAVAAAPLARRYGRTDVQPEDGRRQGCQGAQVQSGNVHQDGVPQQHHGRYGALNRRRRSRSPPGKPKLVISTLRMIEKVKGVDRQERCQPAIPSLLKDVAQHSADAAVIASSENISLITRIRMRKELERPFLAHMRERQQDEGRLEGAMQGRSTSVATSASALDKRRRRRSRQRLSLGKTDVAIEEPLSSESRGSSPSSSSISRVSPSYITTQGEATMVHPRKGKHHLGSCCEVSTLLSSLTNSLSVTSSLVKAKQQQQPLQEQQLLPVYSALQQRDRTTQHDRSGTVRSSDLHRNRSVLPAESTAFVHASRVKVEATTGTRLLLLPSAVARKGPRAPACCGSLATCERLTRPGTGHTCSQCNPYCRCRRIWSDTSSAADHPTCGGWGTSSRKNSVASEISRGAQNDCDVPAPYTRGRKDQTECRNQTLVPGLPPITASGTAGYCSAVSAGSRSSSLEANNSTTVCVVAEPGCQAEGLMADKGTEGSLRLHSDSTLRCDAVEPSKHRLRYCRFAKFIRIPPYQHGSQDSSSSRHYSAEVRTSKPGSGVAPALKVSHSDANVASSVECDSCVTIVEEVAPPILRRNEAQKLRENGEGQHNREGVQGSRFPSSTITSSKSLSQSLLSKGARLVLWQENTDVSLVPPKQRT